MKVQVEAIDRKPGSVTMQPAGEFELAEFIEANSKEVACDIIMQLAQSGQRVRVGGGAAQEFLLRFVK